jgi:hypothetical protein
VTRREKEEIEGEKRGRNRLKERKEGREKGRMEREKGGRERERERR